MLARRQSCYLSDGRNARSYRNVPLAFYQSRLATNINDVHCWGLTRDAVLLLLLRVDLYYTRYLFGCTECVCPSAKLHWPRRQVCCTVPLLLVLLLLVLSRRPAHHLCLFRKKIERWSSKKHAVVNPITPSYATGTYRSTSHGHCACRCCGAHHRMRK